MFSVYPCPPVVHPSACFKTHHRGAEGAAEAQRTGIFSVFDAVSSALSAVRFQRSSTCRLAICLLTIILHSSFLILNCSAQGVITTIAGGAWVFRGDGGPATSAPLGQTRAVAVDWAGHVFVADSDNHLVAKISPAGNLTVVAENGICCFSGDGRPATSASLYQPFGVAIDTVGNLYIADTFNRRIRKVNPGGIITTLAGTGVARFSGDGGPSTSASLSLPYGLAVDGSGNLYIADRSDSRVRKVSPNGIITTVAGGSGTGGLGDGGPAARANLDQPEGVAVDTAGNLNYPPGMESCLKKRVMEAEPKSHDPEKGGWEPVGPSGRKKCTPRVQGKRVYTGCRRMAKKLIPV